MNSIEIAFETLFQFIVLPILLGTFMFFGFKYTALLGDNIHSKMHPDFAIEQQYTVANR